MRSVNESRYWVMDPIDLNRKSNKKLEKTTGDLFLMIGRMVEVFYFTFMVLVSLWQTKAIKG